MYVWYTVTNSTVVDGSGTVTGLAFYKLKQELAVMSAEKEEQRVKMVKATERLARLTTERYILCVGCHN